MPKRNVAKDLVVAKKRNNPFHLGVGLGLRREHFGSLLDLYKNQLPPEIAWFEVAPENYMEIGGKVYRDFCHLAERIPIVAHSVSMSLGSLDPLNRPFFNSLKKFIRKHKMPLASDHISFSSYNGVQFDDLLPLPSTEESVKYISKRIRQVSDILEVPFAVENPSYYAPAGAPDPCYMKEEDFISEIVKESGALLLLDVNNIFVNSVNHKFDPHTYLKKLPLDRIAYVHMAGHYRKKEDFILDTHGSEIIHPVWKLLDELASMTQLPGVMIERDDDIPPIEELTKELRQVHKILKKYPKNVFQTPELLDVVA
ncbi:MAG: DUF692 domain-containing protein [Deltaproteobacteria bacterium]|nr:MAG: DUF692 domain-containing protein [Deltaproteobacteria bacterium]